VDLDKILSVGALTAFIERMRERTADRTAAPPSHGVPSALATERDH
jgi:hypothetical protein